MLKQGILNSLDQKISSQRSCPQTEVFHHGNLWPPPPPQCHVSLQEIASLIRPHKGIDVWSLKTGYFLTKMWSLGFLPTFPACSSASHSSSSIAVALQHSSLAQGSNLLHVSFKKLEPLRNCEKMFYTHVSCFSLSQTWDPKQKDNNHI